MLVVTKWSGSVLYSHLFTLTNGSVPGDFNVWQQDILRIFANPLLWNDILEAESSLISNLIANSCF